MPDETTDDAPRPIEFETLPTIAEELNARFPHAYFLAVKGPAKVHRKGDPSLVHIFCSLDDKPTTPAEMIGFLQECIEVLRAEQRRIKRRH